ncbi:MAG: secretin N-terminal domain-containing protein [Gammaproteobacteria bacterium]
MTMRHLLILPLMLLSCVLAMPGRADTTLHVIELHHRSASEIIPILRPLLAQDEAMTGTGYQLIVRAAPARMQELEAVVHQLDKAPQRLRITVRRASRSQMKALGLDAGGGAGTGRARVYSTDRGVGPGLNVVHRGADGEVHSRVLSTESRDTHNDVQQLQVVEGRDALIRFGLSFPVPQQSVSWVNGQPVVQDTLAYKDIGSGFYVRARIKGDTATVDISPQRQALAPEGGGMITSQQLTTTVSGKVGHWLDLGGAAGATDQQDAGTVYRTEQRGESRDRVWLKVDIVH